MAQITYRGNLASKVFPFLASQFGRTVIVSGPDQAAANNTGESAGGDNNLPQAYYMHNVLPTAQGYKSVGYKNLIPEVGGLFVRVIPVRDPDMTQGWIGVTASGKLYIYRAGDKTWTDISVLGWAGNHISVAFANGYTYVCLANFRVYKVGVATKTLTPVVLNGLNSSGIVAITAAANYLIATDGVQVYWSSTITPEDFEPSLVTGAGSGKPTDVAGTIVALAPIGTGFAIYTTVNIVVASYSQNAKFPWIFKGSPNSKGISDIDHIAASADDGSNYVWTSAGLQRIGLAAAVTVMGEVTDFLASQQFEDFDTQANKFINQYVYQPLRVKLAFIGARYLVISYGVMYLTHALIYDTALRRWGKLKYTHSHCFEVSFNTDKSTTDSVSASAKKTLGFVTDAGKVVVCDLTDNAEAADSVLILGKFQITRSRMTTLDGVFIECVDDDNTSFNVETITTLDGKTPEYILPLAPLVVSEQYREYGARVTGLNHSLILKGKFNINSFELAMHVNGRR